MSPWLVGWLIFSAVVLLVLFVSYGIVHYFSDDREQIEQGKSTFSLTKVIGAVSLTACLLAILMIPVDVYVVSSHHNDDFSAFTSQRNTVKVLYVLLYSLILVCLFVLLPFGYFYYEEEGVDDDDDEDYGVRAGRRNRERSGSRGKQCFGAFKYTLVFLLVMVLLVVIGYLFTNGTISSGIDTSGDDVSVPIALKKLNGYFTNQDLILAFVFGCLDVLGFIGFVTYTAYGMAYLPFSLYPRSNNGNSGDDDVENEIDSDAKIRRIDNKLNYYHGKAFKSKEDEDAIKELTRQKDRLAAISRNTRGDNSISITSDRRTKRCCQDFAARFFWPFRVILSVLSLILSLLIVVSLLISLFDRGLNSTCGMKCGFLLDSPSYINPLNELQVVLAKYFPSDYIMFTLLVVYLFGSSLTGLLQGGVRLFWIKLFDIERKRTLHNALLAGIWFLSFVLVSVSIQVIALLPQYSTFGFQKDSAGNECSFSRSSMNENSTECVPSQISVFNSGMQSRLPAFGTIFYIAQAIFVVSYISVGLYSLYRYKTRVQENEHVEYKPIVRHNENDDNY
jgi:LMBR1 domain-containing protein 1